MTHSPRTPGVVSGRLPSDVLAENFDDLHPVYDSHEAMVAADRCYFCHDAPCITACPTAIDIPLFIRQIQTGHPEGAAKTILEQNILGGMCARVCPTETLCEEACVREAAEGKPVEIGRLQRFATDRLVSENVHPFSRGEATGTSVAVVGAGPAGLACAHRLAMKGHAVVVFDARPKPGGLNEYGIASYKTVNDFAQVEVDWLLQIGGIEMVYDRRFGEGDLTVAALVKKYDAVFLGIGLAGVNGLGVEGAELAGVHDAVDFIATLRQSGDLSDLAVGRRVVVIGGGMTAVDAAVQSKLLGAEEVTIAYRRGKSDMPASAFEQDLATSKGVRLMNHVQPKAIHGQGAVKEIELEYTEVEGGALKGTGEFARLEADQVLLAIGQTLDGELDGLTLEGGKIAVTGAGRTTVTKVWAGGDCASGGDDLTVTAVAEGRDAAEDIHAALMG